MLWQLPLVLVLCFVYSNRGFTNVYIPCCTGVGSTVGKDLFISLCSAPGSRQGEGERARQGGTREGERRTETIVPHGHSD